MKKLFALILALVMVILLAACGKSSVVGVYKTDSWDGKTGTLVLYEDGTCQYPSGGDATWTLKENTVIITIESSITTFDEDEGVNRITILLDDTLSEAEAKATVASIAKLDNVESTYLLESNKRLCEIALCKTETDSKTLDMLSEVEGVKIVQSSNVAIFTFEHEAKIMESGLVLQGHFFEKVSN